MEKDKPIYTLEKQKTSPYIDYVKLHFNLNKLLYLVVIILGFLILVTNIIFNIIGANVYSIIIYAFTGLLILLLFFSLCILPILQRKRVMKANEEYIDFYPDRLVVRYQKDNQENQIEIIYELVKKKKQTKSSYLIYQGKIGLLLSKDNEYPKEIKAQLDLLTAKAKR